MNRWAMIGRSEGNGHPYSWSAICNGYNPVEMNRLAEFMCIPAYLDAMPRGEFGVDGAKITHVWMPDRREAEFCAQCSLIPNVVERPEDVIGSVDAVIIATDMGETHLQAAMPFLQAGLPIFIDKPLCLSLRDLESFAEFRRGGARIMSCSSARFCPEFIHAAALRDYGTVRTAHVTVPHAWETYGIHGVEGLIHFFGVCAAKVSTLGNRDGSVTTIEFEDGRTATVSCIEGGNPEIWMEINRSKSKEQIVWNDSFRSFRDSLRAFQAYLTTGQEPFPFSETAALMETIAAGIASRERGGACIELETFRSESRGFPGLPPNPQRAAAEDISVLASL